ncbi:MAG: hypothetical protein ACM3PU_08555 [Gemmatimonadota bacterium]
MRLRIGFNLLRVVFLLHRKWSSGWPYSCEYIGARCAALTAAGRAGDAMSLGNVTAVAAMSVLLAGGCGLPHRKQTTGVQPMANGQAQIVRSALAHAARTSGLAPSALVVESAIRVIWPDGSLGCPEPGMVYTQALVPGYRIRIRAGDALLDYHASARGELTLCPPGRSTEPLPDSST